MIDSGALLAAALLATVVSAVGAGAFRRWARNRSLLDLPNPRSSHTVPTPRGGGVGIVGGFFVGFGLWLELGGVISPRAAGWLAGALLVATVSFIDDLHSLPAPLRLAAHFAAALLLTFAGVQERSMPALLALPLAFLWVVLVTNIYNFMDGIDGLAAGQAIVAGLAYAAAGVLVRNPLVASAGALLAAASAGFLLYNLPPARLFMGDVSSTFLGFNFAGLALLGNLGVGGGRLPLEFGMVVLAPFLFDGLTTLGRRMARGERWYAAHRSHYYQRLVQAGLSHGQVSAAYVALACVSAAFALAGLALDAPARLALGALAFVPMLGVVVAVRRLERRAALATGA